MVVLYLLPRSDGERFKGQEVKASPTVFVVFFERLTFRAGLHRVDEGNKLDGEGGS